MKKYIIFVIIILIIVAIVVSAFVLANNTGKISLTMEDISSLVSQKKESLTWKDFEKFTSTSIDSGIDILQYDIDEDYQLTIGGVSDKSPMYMRLIYLKDSNMSIDIRYDDLEEFLNATR